MKQLTLIFIFMISQQLFGHDDIKAHFFINGQALDGHHVMVKPNSPINVEVFFTETSTGEVIKDFKTMHGKIMHMAIIKKDLSVFRHVHPYFEPLSGRFQLVLNVASSDPDNFQNDKAIPEPGMYMIMTDIEPRGIGMRMAHAHLHVMGEAEKQMLELDEAKIINSELVITKDFYPEFNGKTTFVPYLAIMKWSENIGCNGKIVNIAVNLYQRTDKGLVKLSNFTPWLDAGAHAMVFSQKLMNQKGMAMAHMHSKLPPRLTQTIDDKEEGTGSFIFNKEGNDFSFEDEDDFLMSFFDDGVLSQGMQKMFLQLKLDGVVQTIPFTFDLSEYQRNQVPGC